MPTRTPVSTQHPAGRGGAGRCRQELHGVVGAYNGELFWKTARQFLNVNMN